MRLGLTLGLVAVGVSGLLPSVSRAQEVPPSDMFLLDTSESMLEFSEYLPEAFTPGYSPTTSTTPGTPGFDSKFGHFINTGCSDPALVAAMSWFDNGSAGFEETPYFEPDKFYHARGRRIAWAVEDFPWSLSASTSALNAVSNSQAACYQITNWETSEGWWDSPLMRECHQCLETKGWWRGPLITANTSYDFNDSDFPATGGPLLPPEAYRKWIVSGGVLNVRPPKFVLESAASGVRMGVEGVSAPASSAR